MAKIAFVWYWDRASEIYPNWRDGLRAAIEVIEKDHQVDWYFDKEIPPSKNNYDFILFWADSTCEFFDYLDRYSCKKGICLTTNPVSIENLRKVDAVYCESTPVYEQVRMNGLRAIKAFGTDTNFYTPNSRMSKIIEYFYPATFSPWKRQSEIALKLGSNLLCVGTVQPDGKAELEACVKHGVRVELGYFDPEIIKSYYHRSKKVIIPAIHGSERTVLEAMSCNIFPIITNPQVNQKAASYVEEYMEEKKKNKDVTPRQFVLKYYSPEIYAKNLLRGMK